MNMPSPLSAPQGIVPAPFVPRAPIAVRAASADDLPFIDSLQKPHTRMVGWMPAQQLQGKVQRGHVIIAEDAAGQPIGYCIGHDQYFKRDDVGVIYQLNVAPARRRSLVGATLVKAMFDRSAYGCKLFCCWCAQDIEANAFWESLGFVPLAFRAGSRGKGRVHIFWQRRIRAGDTTTPYWFPAQTSSGSIREDRIVLPIPPGTHWRDAKPLVLPGAAEDEPRRLPAAQPKKRARAVKPPSAPAGGLWFTGPRAPAPVDKPAPAEKPKRAPKQKVKNDPRLIAAARELRDRWLEHANAEPSILTSGGKYDVSKVLAPGGDTVPAIPALPALPAPIAACRDETCLAPRHSTEMEGDTSVAPTIRRARRRVA